jgi:hypothetical protein
MYSGVNTQSALNPYFLLEKTHPALVESNATVALPASRKAKSKPILSASASRRS